MLCKTLAAKVPIPWNPHVSVAEALAVHCSYCTKFYCSGTAVISLRARQRTDIGRDCLGQNDADGETMTHEEWRILLKSL